MAMANSVEIRMPFLDYRLVEFAARLPDRLKIRVLNEKYLLKQCARPYLPPSVIGRPKQPYRAPDGRGFFAGAPPAYLTSALSRISVAERGVFNPVAVDALRLKFESRRVDGLRDNMALVGVLSTELLMQQFVDHFTTGPASHADRAAAAAVHR